MVGEPAHLRTRRDRANFTQNGLCSWDQPTPEAVVPLPNRYDTKRFSLLTSKTNVPKNAAEAPQKWFQDNQVEAFKMSGELQNPDVPARWSHIHTDRGVIIDKGPKY